MSHLDSCLAKIAEIQGTKTWDVSSVLSVGVALASHVNGIANLKGSEKKALVLECLRLGLKKAEQTEIQGAETQSEKEIAIAAIKERYARLQTAVEETLPISLDLVVSAARGEFDLKKVEPSLVVRLLCCCIQQGVSAVLTSQGKSEAAATALSVAGTAEKAANQAVATAIGKSSSTRSTRKPSVSAV